MGRHRRSGAAPAADEYAAGAAGTHRGHRGARRKKRALPLRGGLLGASAALAVGAVAVTSGILPGGETFTIGGGSSPQEIRSSGTSDLDAQGRAEAVPSTGTPSVTAAPSASPSPAAPSKSPSPKPSTASPKPTPTPARTASPTPVKTRTPAPPPRTEAAPVPERTTESPTPRLNTTSRAAAAEAAVLELVNQERAGAGCAPVRASTELGDLARAFSQDMAARDFFSHTDPDGDGPWERAAQAGVEGLGGENIARGQADAAAVMESWMNSEGHRANILNCDFKRLGVGVHIAAGGPWWTQNFGF